MIVSHRLASLVECDQILVMDRGKVIDVAPHTVLLERCAIYRALWLQQNRHMDPGRCEGSFADVDVRSGRLEEEPNDECYDNAGNQLTRSQSAQMPALCWSSIHPPQR